jgi:hypothetical protein
MREHELIYVKVKPRQTERELKAIPERQPLPYDKPATIPPRWRV